MLNPSDQEVLTSAWYAADCPPELKPKLTPRELSRCVQLLGQGRTLPQAIDVIQAERLPLFPEVL